MSSAVEEKNLPVVLSMGALYEAVLKDLIPLKLRDHEDFQALIDRFEQIQKMELEIQKITNKMKKTKQYNRRVELNRNLNQLSANCADLRS